MASGKDNVILVEKEGMHTEPSFFEESILLVLRSLLRNLPFSWDSMPEVHFRYMIPTLPLALLTSIVLWEAYDRYWYRIKRKERSVGSGRQQSLGHNGVVSGEEGVEISVTPSIELSSLEACEGSMSLATADLSLKLLQGAPTHCEALLRFRTFVAFVTVAWVVFLHTTLGSFDSMSSVGAYSRGKSCNKRLCMMPLNVLCGVLLHGLLILHPRAWRESCRNRKSPLKKVALRSLKITELEIAKDKANTKLASTESPAAWLESSSVGAVELTCVCSGVNKHLLPSDCESESSARHAASNAVLSRLQLIGLVSSDVSSVGLLLLSSLFATVPSFCIIYATLPSFYWVLRWTWTCRLSVMVRCLLLAPGNTSFPWLWLWNGRGRGRRPLSVSDGSLFTNKRWGCDIFGATDLRAHGEFYRNLTIRSFVHATSIRMRGKADHRGEDLQMPEQTNFSDKQDRRANEGEPRGRREKSSLVPTFRGSSRRFGAAEAHAQQRVSYHCPPHIPMPTRTIRVSPIGATIALLTGLAPTLLSVTLVLFQVSVPLFALYLDRSLWKHRPAMYAILIGAFVAFNAAGQSIFYFAFICWPHVREYARAVRELGGTKEAVVWSRYVNGLLRVLGRLVVPNVRLYPIIDKAL